MKVLRAAIVCCGVFALAACGGGESAESGGVVEKSADAAPAAQAQPVDERAQQAVKVRKALFTLVYNNFGPIAGMARGRVPFDADVAAVNATRVSQLAQMASDVFAYDTRNSGVETEALDAIWENGADFATRVSDFTAAADALAAAAATGDEAAIKAATGGLGKTCGGCHDNFREDDD